MSACENGFPQYLALTNKLVIDYIEKTDFKASKKWVESLVLKLNVNNRTFLKPLCWDHTRERGVLTLLHYPTVLMPDVENIC